MRKSEEEPGAVLLRYGKSVLLGGAVAFGVGVIFLLLAAVGISRGMLAAGLHYQLTVVACVLGGFSGGLFAVRRCPARGLFVGLATGAVLFFLQLTIGLLFYDSFSLEGGGLGLLFGALCGGAAAGILGGGGKRKRSPSAKKYRTR